MTSPVRNYAKPFFIAGFIIGELLMLYTVLAPNMKGLEAAPWSAQLNRVLVGSIFFGPFGAAAGLGIGLLWTGLLSQVRSFRRGGAKESPAEKE